MPASSRTHTTRARSSSPSSSKPYDCYSLATPNPTKARLTRLKRSRSTRVKTSASQRRKRDEGQEKPDGNTNVDANVGAETDLARHSKIHVDIGYITNEAYVDSKADADADPAKADPKVGAKVEPKPEPEPELNIPPDLPGLPTYATYKRIETNYLHGLSPRKRDKALITQAMFDKIWDVLHEPDACTVETPQFRFWVRKMFTLVRPKTRPGAGTRAGTAPGRTGTTTGMEMEIGWVSMGRAAGAHADDYSDSEGEEADLELERAMGIGRAASASELLLTAVVLHENRPVAIREQLYELFCYCHVRSGHGGRDKTCAVIRKHYSWVPKELTAQFVKACPTCIRKKAGEDTGFGFELVHKRSRASKKVKRERAKVGALGEETSMLILPPLLDNVGWSATEGSLNPAIPGLCGVGEQGHGSKQERTRPHEQTKTVGQSSPVSSPVEASRMHPLPGQVRLENWSPGGWDTGVLRVPQTLMLGTSQCAIGPSPQLPMDLEHDTGVRSDQWEAKHSPRRLVTELPSLASALVNKSLDDDNVNLSALLGPETRMSDGSVDGPDLVTAAAHMDGECLPPTLRPLRLSGPVTPPRATSVITSSPSLPPLMIASPFQASTYLFPSDPMFLPFDMDGWSPGIAGASGSVCYGRGPGTDVSLSMSTSTGFIMLCGGERELGTGTGHVRPGSPGLSLYDRLRALSSELGSDADLDMDMDMDMDVHGLETPELVRSSDGSPDSSMDGAMGCPMTTDLEVAVVE